MRYKSSLFFVCIFVLMLLFYSIGATLLELVITTTTDENPISGIFDNIDKYSDLNTIKKEIVFNKNTYKIDRYNSFKIIGYIMALISAYRIFSKRKNKLAKKYKDSNYGSHGTARWQNLNEIKRNFYNKKNDLGWIIGDIEKETFVLGETYAVHPVQKEKIREGLKLKYTKTNNMQLNIIGAPGSDKTTGFLLPNMFNLPFSYMYHYLDKKKKFRRKTDIAKDFAAGNMIKDTDFTHMPDIIVTDPKGEITELTYNYYESIGYEIWILDYIHLKYGNQVNYLDFIKSEKDIKSLSDNIVNTLRGMEGTQINANPIWTKGASAIFAFCISYCFDTLGKDERNIDNVINILEKDDISDPELSLVFHETNEMTDLSKALYRKWLRIGGSLREGILGGLAIDLTLFSFGNVRKMTEKSTVDFTQLGRKRDRPIMLYLWISDSDSTFKPLVNTVTGSMMNIMYDTASETGNRLEREVYVKYEEKYSVGVLPSLKQKLTTMRGRRIYPMIIWQALWQANDLYSSGSSKGMNVIQSTCDCFISLGVNDMESATFVSDRLGKKTIKVQSKNTNDKSDIKSVNSSYSGRSLLTEDEVFKYNPSKSIICERGMQPVTLNKTVYRHWEKDKLVCDRINISDIPKFYEDKKLSSEPRILTIKTEENVIPKIELKKEEKLEIKHEEKIKVKHEENLDTEKVEVNVKQVVEEKQEINQKVPDWYLDM